MNKALFLKIGGGIKHKGAKLFAKKRRVRKGCLEYLVVLAEWGRN
jgi:hypothetical protein